MSTTVPETRVLSSTTSLADIVPSTTVPVEMIPTVRVSVEIDDLGVDASAEIEIGQSADFDLFGRFASCSGLRPLVGTYLVQVSDLDGGFGAFGLITDEPITGPGTVGASVRVEPTDDEPLVATGTATFDADLRSGTFVAFDALGRTVEGTFECSGSGDGPDALLVGSDLVEVFALARRGDAERIVGVTSDTSTGEASCPLAEDPASDEVVVVRSSTVDGYGGVAVTVGPPARLSVDVPGERDLDVEVVLELHDPPGSGSFHGHTDDGTEVEGAFSCS